jgi:hypothetical protein
MLSSLLRIKIFERFVETIYSGVVGGFRQFNQVEFVAGARYSAIHVRFNQDETVTFHDVVVLQRDGELVFKYKSSESSWDVDVDVESSKDMGYAITWYGYPEYLMANAIIPATRI